MNPILQKAKNIQCLVCDVDGVLSDGLLYLDNQGNELKTFHVHDGVGLKLLMSAGLFVTVITTSRNAVINYRMEQLGITLYYKGQLDKREAYYQLKQTLSLDDEQLAYIGDDLPDLPLIQQAGLGIAVANALPEVKKQADWVTVQKGGFGAVREVCDFILDAQGKTANALEKYLGTVNE